MAVHSPQKHGPATWAKTSKKMQELLNEPIRGPTHWATHSKTPQAMHTDLVLGPATNAEGLRSIKLLKITALAPNSATA